MQVITKNPGEAPKIVDVEPSSDGEIPYDFMSKSVKGYIERVTLKSNDDFSETVSVWVNEEGLLKQMPLNVVLTHASGHQTHLVGPLLVTATKGEKTVGLSALEIPQILAALGGAQPTDN